MNTNCFSDAVLDMETVWNPVNEERCLLLLLKANKDALSHANIVDLLPTPEFELEDKPGNNLDDLQACRSVLSNGERALKYFPLISDNNNSIIE